MHSATGCLIWRYRKLLPPSLSAGLSHLTPNEPQSPPSPLVGEGWGGGCLFDSAELVPPSRLARSAREPTSPTRGEVTESPRTHETAADRPGRRRGRAPWRPTAPCGAKVLASRTRRHRRAAR